jgi:hypothetical protein
VRQGKEALSGAPPAGRRVPSHPVHRERHEADVFARRGWTLDRRALVTTHGAASAAAKLVARYLSAPTDHRDRTGERGVV